MKNRKKYFKDIDNLRILACLAIIFYHLGILKGGYLAVSTFFILSSFLTIVSFSKDKKLSIKKYYLNRFLKLYLPLVLIVFITVGLSSFLRDINWFNLKSETLSILFGYNNFWQLNASLDYFSRHIDSPFMHLWYISILFQFDLIIPFIYLGLKKISEKISKKLSIIIPSALGIISFITFVIINNTNMMFSYYNTFTRSFSWFFGISLGFLEIYYGKSILKKLKDKKRNYIILSIYMTFLLLAFIFCKAERIILPLGMGAVTAITLLIIPIASVNEKTKLSTIEKIIKSLSSVSYEIYLIQYPVIFFFQSLNINYYLKVLYVIIITITLSYLIHFVFYFKNKGKKILLITKYLLTVIIVVFSLYGSYVFFKTPNYTKEIEAFEMELSEKEKLLEERQNEYFKNLEKLNEDWQLELKDFEENETNLKEVVTNLPIVGIGDSVMLGAVDNLGKQFPNSYFDAKVSRTAWVLNDILKELKNKKAIKGPVVISLGANGDCSKSCKEEVMKTLKEHEVFWVNTTNNNNFNKAINDFAQDYNNLHIIDWKNISKDHNEYFVADKIHLTTSGRKAYTSMLYNEIYKVYLDKLKKEKDNMIKEHKNNLKNKLTFYGNTLLLSAFSHLENDFKDANFVVDKDFNYESLKSTIEIDIKENKITNRIILILDNNALLTEENYENLISLLKEKEIYILITNKKLKEYMEKLEYDNVKVLDFYSIICEHPDYLLTDDVNLSNIGAEALNTFLKKNLL